MSKLKENLLKMVALATELERANAIEGKTYHLVQDTDTRYFLIRLSDNEIVADGYQKRIKSYCNLRNIDKDSILDAELIY